MATVWETRASEVGSELARARRRTRARKRAAYPRKTGIPKQRLIPPPVEHPTRRIAACAVRWLKLMLPRRGARETLRLMVTITGEYQGGLHCTARHEPSGNTLITDAPKDNQGRGEAFSPTDLLATAFATCVATTMAIAARKHGVELDGFRYEVTKEMSADAPRRISRLALQIWLPASASKVDRALLERAAHGCPVHRSLAPEVEKLITFHGPAAA